MKKLTYFPLLLLLLLSSCTYYNQVPIEVYKPQDIEIPPEQRTVAIFSRNFKYDHDTLQNIYELDGKLIRSKVSAAQTDSSVVQSTINELARQVKDKPFTQVKILPYSAFKVHSNDKMPKLEPLLIEKINTNYNVDYLISLETLSYFYSRTSKSGYSPETRKVITASIWALYDTHTKEIINRKSIIDTLYWDKYNQQGEYQVKKKLPPRSKALQIAGEMAAKKYAKIYAPSWQTVTRNFAVPPLPDFQLAEQYVSDGEWDNAMALWQKYVNDSDGKLSINALYNMALGYEVKDQIPKSLGILVEAEKLAISYNSKDDLKKIKAYVRVLNNRLREISKLNSQY